jgi:hypothetical protein
MGSEVAPRVVEGRVIPAGVAIAVTRSQDLVQVVLTVMRGHPAANLRAGQAGVVPFPVLVPVAAGERVAIVVRWAHGGEECTGPVWMPAATVLARAHIRR